MEESSLDISQRIHHRSVISYPDLTLFYTGRGRSGYEINRSGHWNNIKKKNSLNLGKRECSQNRGQYFTCFSNGSSSSMFSILRFFDVFPREEDWNEWNCELCHVFGWESMSHVLIHFRWLISAEGRATWPYVKGLNRWNPHSTIITKKQHPAYIIHWSALNLREN